MDFHVKSSGLSVLAPKLEIKKKKATLQVNLQLPECLGNIFYRYVFGRERQLPRSLPSPPSSGIGCHPLCCMNGGITTSRWCSESVARRSLLGRKRHLYLE